MNYNVRDDSDKEVMEQLIQNIESMINETELEIKTYESNDDKRFILKSLLNGCNQINLESFGLKILNETEIDESNQVTMKAKDKLKELNSLKSKINNSLKNYEELKVNK